ncbi:MAG: hypothetical protein ACE5J5_04110 [Candidatus Hydrothermarchaeales archaeon]
MKERMLCPNCKAKVFVTEENCPKCGYEIKAFVQSTTWWGIIGLLFITFGLIASVINSSLDYIGVGLIVATPPLIFYYRNRQRIERLSLRKRKGR